ncbi:esterase/lipase family protein [Corynebacterium epidermidicanis]|uniref:Alpha/beta hydrolase family n=1 Tax=Corynebacterium epidermidicanis TaxID=1050174 RepID=A0A0G3GL65_9CORY|nr:alpha/beta fold hydrolase [Corynebacterium epidermidicanis]AKK01981.1 Alpha/beta hydrolase family [Corynebacterium epidermidicanis]
MKRLIASVCTSLLPLAALVAPAAAAETAPVITAKFESSAPASWGINDSNCVPTGDVKEPVILIHGTSDNASNWGDVAPVLKRAGMCVWAFDYGADDITLQNMIPSLKAIGDLDVSAREVADQVTYVREVTGAEKVNLVGHSQGGMHTKTYEQLYGEPGTVARVVAIGGNYHGTTLGGMATALLPLIKGAPGLASFLASTAGIQQVLGSEFMTRLNEHPDTVAGVQYTSIYSPADTTVTPNSASQLTAVPGADVVNVDLGATCAATPRHDRLPHDATAISEIVWGLTRAAGDDNAAAGCVRS